jgi:hypothetical protein
MCPVNLKFMFKGMPVGHFEESEYPRRDGRYRYMPYRGPGHLQMQTELRNSARAECHYEFGGERVTFAVEDYPEYGVLELANFERAQLDNHG